MSRAWSCAVVMESNWDPGHSAWEHHPAPPGVTIAHDRRSNVRSGPILFDFRALGHYSIQSNLRRLRALRHSDCGTYWHASACNEEEDMKGEAPVRRSLLRPAGRIIVLICGGLVFSGCVLSEKYEAEKARSLNFQRLLAQEEKRTGELDNEVKRTKRELAEYETRNRELSAQVQAVREQL